MVNIQDILFIFMQGFSGAVAGYITNKYAVNMIFKEYTPLKIGGAVKKNKEKFIQEVSELVEKDIINSQTLIGSIKSKNFSDVIDSACIDFMTDSLNEVFKGIKLKNIPKISISTEQCITFIEQNLQEELPKLIDNLSNKINIKDLANEEQLAIISQKIIKLIIETLETEGKLEEFLVCLYDENKNITLSQILKDKTKDDLIKNLSNIIKDSISNIIDDEGRCTALIINLCELLDLKSILLTLQNSLEQRTIQDIATEEDIEYIGNLLFKNIKVLIANDQNKENIKQIISEVLVVARDVEVTLLDVLPDDLANSIVSYIRYIIPDIAPHVSNWLYENKTKIDKTINTAVGETINKTEDPSFKSIADKFGGMIDTISQTLKLVERVANMVEEYDLTPEASEKIYLAISKFFEETTIGEIVELIDNKLSIDDEYICQSLLSLFDKSGEVLIKKLIFNFKEKKISELVKIDLVGIFNLKIIPLIYKSIKSNKEKINKKIARLLKSKIETILNNNIADLIPKERVRILSKKFPKLIAKYIGNNQAICEIYIKKLVSSNLENIDLEKMILENKESLIILICKKFDDLEKIALDKLKNKELNDMLNLIKDKQGFSLSLSQKIHKGLVNNAEKVIDNNVQRVIYNNLIKLDEDEICNIAQSFMGKQLKPLSYFGALLGTIAGLVFAFTISGTINNFGFYSKYQTIIIACILMGLVGILTNVVALWMIFHPYKKNKFVAKIPIFRIFAQGYIPSHKDSFAKGMAYFIDNELLKGKRVEDLFNSKKYKFSNSIYSFVSNNNFKILVDIASEKKNKISKFLYEFIINQGIKNKTKIAKSLAKVSDNLNIDTALTKQKVLEVSENLLSNLDKIQDSAIKFAQERLNKQNTLNELLPASVLDYINNSINETIDNTIKISVDKVLKDEFVKVLVLNNDAFYEGLKSKSIAEIVGSENLSKLQKSVEVNLNNYIINDLSKILDKSLKNILQTQLSKETKIGEIFNGSIRIILDKKLYSITAVLLRRLNNYAQNNKEKVVEIFLTIIRGQLNFFVKMAYDFMNGDRLVSLVILDIIETKLEDFINETMYSTIKTVSISLKSAIYPTTVQNIGLVAENINTELVVDTLVEGIKQNDDIFNSVDELVLVAIKKATELKIKDIIQETNINTLEGLYDLIKHDVSLALSNINDNYNENIQNINDFINTYIYKELTLKVLNKSLESLLDIDLLTSDIVKLAVKQFSCNTLSKNIILQSIEKSYDNNIVGIRLNQILNQDILALNLEKYLEILFKDIDFNENNQYIIDKIVFNCIESEFKFINDETKEYITRKMVDALLTTGIGFTVDAMKALKLKEITTEQVEIMDSREIHMLFNAFAGDFFIKLYLYGSMGAVFGVNMYLSIVLWILDWFYSRKVENFEIKTDNIFKE